MSEQFIKVYDWMLELGLPGKELLVYAIIYSLSENSNGCLGQKYITERLNVSERWTRSAIANLRDKGLIMAEKGNSCFDPYRYLADRNYTSVRNDTSERNDTSVRNHTSERNDTSVRNHSSERNDTSVRNHSSATIGTILPNASGTILPNALYIEKNIDKNKHKNTHSDFERFFSELSIDSSPDLIEAVRAFQEHRKKLKKPMTDRALKLNLKKARDLSDGTTKGIIELLDLAIEKGWQGVYLPKEDKYEQESDEDFFAGID